MLYPIELWVPEDVSDAEIRDGIKAPALEAGKRFVGLF
jgi:hypothetical protein